MQTNFLFKEKHTDNEISPMASSVHGPKDQWGPAHFHYLFIYFFKSLNCFSMGTKQFTDLKEYISITNMELGPAILSIISVLRPKYAYSMHICPTGIKINCDNEVFLECNIPYGTVKETFSYDYPTAQSVFSVRNGISLGPLTATSRFLAIVANPSHLPELSVPFVSETVWTEVSREYLLDAINCVSQTHVTISVEINRVRVANGNIEFLYPCETKGQCEINIGPEMVIVLAEFLGALGSSMVEIAVGEDIAFGIRNCVDWGSYFRGPRYTIWIPHF